MLTFLLPLVLLLGAPLAHAFNIYNYTGFKIKAKVLEGDFDRTINANTNAACSWQSTDCNPSGSRDEILTLQVQTEDSDSRDWFCLLNLQAGGYAVIDNDFDIKETSDIIKSNPQTIIDDVRNRKRNTRKKEKAPNGDPHYSWNWHDVHFVQLNLFPGDEPSTHHSDLDPENSLQFLKDNLSAHVGSTGRPVVLIHHYGFDDFSIDSNVRIGNP